MPDPVFVSQGELIHKCHSKAKPTHDPLTQFVRRGYVIYSGVFDEKLIARMRAFVLERHAYLASTTEQDVNGWAVAIMEQLERSKLYDDMVRTPALVRIAQQYVGPDVAWFAHDGLFLNVPSDKDPVLLKGHHMDAWTGTGMYTVFAGIFLTDVDEYNGLSVCPGSHLQGLMPVKNRAADFSETFETRNLDMVKAGDMVLWHPLLIHSTTGHSDKNIRVSITSRFTSTETAMSSQERALGYRVLSVGPMNQVLRLVGSDYLLPFRTYGGYVGVDRRVAGIYDHSPVKTKRNYVTCLEEKFG